MDGKFIQFPVPLNDVGLKASDNLADYFAGPTHEVVTYEVPSNIMISVEYEALPDVYRYTLKYWYNGEKHVVIWRIVAQALEQMLQPEGFIISSLSKAVSGGLGLNEYQHEYVVGQIRKIVSATFNSDIKDWQNVGWTNDVKIINNAKIHEIGLGTFTSSGKVPDATKSIAHRSESLPGVLESVKPPCDCWEKSSIKNWDGLAVVSDIIIHLNDSMTHQDWTREKIADWLDELHDAGIINIEFEPWEVDNDED